MPVDLGWVKFDLVVTDEQLIEDQLVAHYNVDRSTMRYNRLHPVYWKNYIAWQRARFSRWRGN